VKTEIQTNWIPSQAGDDKECVIPVKTGIQAGLDPASPLCHSRENGNPDRTGSPIRSALLSVEDDGREWIPHLPSVIPVKTGIQSEWIPNPKRFAFG